MTASKLPLDLYDRLGKTRNGEVAIPAEDAATLRAFLRNMNRLDVALRETDLPGILNLPDVRRSAHAVQLRKLCVMLHRM